MYLDFHTHNKNTTSGVVSIVNYFPFDAIDSRFFSVGIHPHYINKYVLDEAFKALEQKAMLDNCLSIGECGLDRLAPVSMELQMLVFEKHIHLSEQLQKPLTIHCVRAFSEILAMRKKHCPKQQWAIHGFRKTNETLAISLINSGIRLSFGVALLHDISLQKLFSNLPPKSFYLETDTFDCSILEVYQQAHKLQHFDNKDIIVNFNVNLNC